MSSWRERRRGRWRRHLCAQLLSRWWHAQFHQPVSQALPRRPTRRTPTPPILILDAPQHGMHLEVGLHQLLTTIGHSPQCDIQVLGAGLLRRHYAMLTLSDGLFGIDLDQTQRDPDASLGCWWTEHTALRLGPFTVRAVLPNYPPLASVSSLLPPGLSLTWTLAGQTFAVPLAARITLLGTSKWCGIRLRDPTLAPVQAALVCSYHAVCLVHLADNHATRARGRPITVWPLALDEPFELGNLSFRLALPEQQTFAPHELWERTLTAWSQTVSDSASQRLELANLLSATAQRLLDRRDQDPDSPPPADAQTPP